MFLRQTLASWCWLALLGYGLWSPGNEMQIKLLCWTASCKLNDRLIE